ncbi:histone acetyltransferase MYST2 [Sarotherodon galilaeus]
MENRAARQALMRFTVIEKFLISSPSSIIVGERSPSRARYLAATICNGSNQHHFCFELGGEISSRGTKMILPSHTDRQRATPWHRWVPESAWHLAHLLSNRLEQLGEAKSNVTDMWEKLRSGSAVGECPACVHVTSVTALRLTSDLARSNAAALTPSLSRLQVCRGHEGVGGPAHCSEQLKQTWAKKSRMASVGSASSTSPATSSFATTTTGYTRSPLYLPASPCKTLQ